MKLSVSDEKRKDRLAAGVYCAEVWRVYEKSQDGSALVDKSGVPYFSVIFRALYGDDAGKTHWQNFFTGGNFSGRTMQLLKASGVIPMDAVDNIDFSPDSLLQKVVGINLVENSRGYINVDSVMTESQYNEWAEEHASQVEQEDIPF